MMIRCENCGKLFDYDKTDGVCPACARYQSQPSPSTPEPRVRGASGPTLQNAYQRPEAQPKPAAPHYARPGAQTPSNRAEARAAAKERGGRRNLVLTAVLAAALAVELAVVAFVNRPSPAQPLFEAPVQQLGGALPVQFQLSGGACWVTGAQVMGAGYAAGVQQGYDLVRVGFEQGKEADWEPAMDDDVYLDVGNAYVQPLGSYDLERLYPELAESVLSRHDLNSYGGTQGYFYFLVPQGTREARICFERASEQDDERTVLAVLQADLRLEEEGVA